MNIFSICRVIFNEYYSWYSIHHLSVEGVSCELSKLLNEMKCSKKWKCTTIKLFDIIKVVNDFCKCKCKCWHYKNCEWLLHTLLSGPSLAGRPFEGQADHFLFFFIAKLSGSQIKSWVALSSLVVPSRPASVTSAFMPIYIDFEHWCQYL